jgi:nitrite reductase (NADH) large subunit
VYRTIDDLVAIGRWAAADGRRIGIVVGGGLLGLEAATALQHLGLEVHVVEMASHLMPQQLDPGGGAMLARRIAERGVEIHCGAASAEIGCDPQGAVASLSLTGGTVVGCDLLVFSAGVRPRDDLGRHAGLEIGERGGVVVDDELRTSAAHVSAVGEVACHRGRLYGLVAPGYDMARTLARRLTGQPGARFTGADLSAKLKLLGVGVASFAGSGGSPGSVETDEIVFADPVARIHRRLVLDRATGRLVGGSLVGDTSGYELLRAVALGRAAQPADLASYVLPASVRPPSGGELPGAAQVCACNDVCAADLRSAVSAGCHSVAALKSETRAGTGCAGCLPAVTDLLNEELRKAGVAVTSSLCEHFDHSRQELFDLVRFHRHTTWAEVLAAHGAGRGCEVCRPAVGSMLGSLSNGYILDGDQAAIQDTNDHALANLQRNGTYSVVPRVPGGEITPGQLIALGEIARDFDLYTKITGGQRIDLLGAQLHQLPAIWRRVVDAGLESGHAYGKAVRTVKSCVGSTWCRYGVQDSVAMAIRIELRYRGLRAPHKLKMAVSGCTRECAEAQGKDVGVIATERGWNLYVGGNGGRQPRHADLLATDLDEGGLLRAVDRFLMFYIRTADRLERTSAWLEKLEGGTDHLRQVVFDDSLGIAAELEADMARHVDRYQCEWAATLSDPARLANFVEFVNAPEATSAPVWIRQRDQRVPAR